MKNIFLFIFVIIGLAFIASCERELISEDGKVLLNVEEAENRSDSINPRLQTLIDSDFARILTVNEYDWWMYHYEVQNFGSSSILPPSSNPFLGVPAPDGGDDPEPLVMICHHGDGGSLGCYGIWSIDDCDHNFVAETGCCNLENSDCEDEGCTCQHIDP